MRKKGKPDYLAMNVRDRIAPTFVTVVLSYLGGRIRSGPRSCLSALFQIYETRSDLCYQIALTFYGRGSGDNKRIGGIVGSCFSWASIHLASRPLHERKSI